jgi:serine/threonine protein kinase
MNVKIIDFGLAVDVNEQSSELSTKYGTPIYMSPEILRQQGSFNEEDEVWSLGVILYLMLIYKHPLYHVFINKENIQDPENIEIIKKTF